MIAVRTSPLLLDELLKSGAGHMAFEPADLVVETLQRGEFFLAAEPGLRNRRFEHPDRLVVYRDGHREGVPVLAAMGERKTRRIAKSARRAVHDFGHQGESLHRAGADAGRQQQVGKVDRSALGGGREVAVQAP